MLSRMEGYVTRRASISPNARKYALTVVSECVIQEESALNVGTTCTVWWFVPRSAFLFRNHIRFSILLTAPRCWPSSACTYFWVMLRFE